MHYPDPQIISYLSPFECMCEIMLKYRSWIGGCPEHHLFLFPTRSKNNIHDKEEYRFSSHSYQFGRISYGQVKYANKRKDENLNVLLDVVSSQLLIANLTAFHHLVLGILFLLKINRKIEPTLNELAYLGLLSL